MIKATLILLCAVTFLGPSQAALAFSRPQAKSMKVRQKCELPWVFFDLGANTLIDTETYDFEKVLYMDGARDYLWDLKAKGYHLGLLVNVPASGPDSWGETQEAKFATTQKYIADHWLRSPGAPEGFDWELFDAGVDFPPTNAERKPAPFLFDQAVARARQAGCDAVYQSTLPEEIPAANRAGMKGIKIGDQLWNGSRYYPEEKLRKREF